MVAKTLGGIPFELKADFDFSFISEYGDVFAVFDRQDSGNLCFGVRRNGGKLFLKMAGAETVNSNVTADEAVRRMKGTVRVYEDLAHQHLTKLLAHREVKGGYLLVFEWFDGLCMGKQYGQRDKFLALPKDEKLAIYRVIMNFHRHVNEKGYIAVDFYCGCIMYNFEVKRVMLCDIELYGKKPYINEMGRMYGSGRYMSPEEFSLGAEIDERSNVFLMGAAAFNLFGEGVDRSRDLWELDNGPYETAMKAVNTEKSDRYQSIGDYINAWDGKTH
jgi:serine/threonine-protein kinase